MTDKCGTPEQRRNSLFSNKDMAGNATCPFKDADIAIVPMRYALDRSPFDVDPAKLTPLSPEGKWEYHPKLQTRDFTLRQLRDGFVYVYDETDDVLHEYRFTAQTASLTRLLWSDAEKGVDVRSEEGESLTYLLYPRTHKLRMGFSPHQWTWRICQQMLNSGVTRASWLRELDLGIYARQMSIRHALPLSRLSKNVVADVDAHPVKHDGRFADSAHPPVLPEGAEYSCVPLASDALWIGTVPDKASALMIALDDPLAMLEDLGTQLASHQAALHEFQAEHEHTLNIAGVVEKLCGVSGDGELLPASVRDDEVKTRQYIRDVEAYFEELQGEDDIRESADGQVLGLIVPPSTALGDNLKATYGSLPDPALLEGWQNRRKWRRQADLNAAHDYADIQLPTLKKLRQRVTETRRDLVALSEHIGSEPMRFFTDTTNAPSLLCLVKVVADLLCNMGQDPSFSAWLQKEEAKDQSTTLFGTARFGFSWRIKEALTHEANRLTQGASDMTSLTTRAGELNSFLNHDELASNPWIKSLVEPAQMTLDALVELAKGAGKSVLETIQLAFLPVDSRLSKSGSDRAASLMLRNLLMGHLMLDHPDRLQIDEDFAKKHAAWKADLKKIRDLYHVAQYRWLHQPTQYDRRTMAKLMQDIQARLNIHLLTEPLLLDYRSQRYGQAMQIKIAKYLEDFGQIGKQWSEHARMWSARNGLNAGAITWGIAALNLFNTAVTYEIASRDGDLDKKDWAKVASAAAYTGNALMAVFVETGGRR